MEHAFLLDVHIVACETRYAGDDPRRRARVTAPSCVLATPDGEERALPQVRARVRSWLARTAAHTV